MARPADNSRPASHSRWQILAAFAAIYLIWGSTYLFIRFAVETIPPFLMAGTRHLIAGGALYAWVRLRGGQRPARSHWVTAAIVGVLLLACGNGGVSWAEQRVDSGAAALLVATMPLWMVLLDAWRSRTRPAGRVAAGLVLGFLGTALLVGPGELAGGGRVDPLGAGVLLFASLAWAVGSLYSRRALVPGPLLLAIAMQSVVGGVVLVALGLGSGEATRFAAGQVSLRSWVSLGYLVALGSLVGFSSYIWLLRVTTPARVSTYAYVNPVVAVVLGWAFGGEPLSARTLVAAAGIVAAVALVISHRAAGEPPSRRVETAAALKPAAASAVEAPFAKGGQAPALPGRRCTSEQ